jgi:rifampin ADP-ribosylating transferase
MYAKDVPPGTVFYHGTKADLAVGDLIRPGFGSNFAERELRHVYFSATLNAATWGAELARGEGRGRIYIVEPTGLFEDDPNLTDKKFPGNVTASYRSSSPLRVTGEVTDWVGHTPEELQAMKDGLAWLKEQGADTIID